MQEQSAIPTQLMTDNQFIQYCASIAKIDPTLPLSSLAQINTLLSQYQPESQGIPAYLLFSITTGAHLLRKIIMVATMDGNFAVPPLVLQKIYSTLLLEALVLNWV